MTEIKHLHNLFIKVSSPLVQKDLNNLILNFISKNNDGKEEWTQGTGYNKLYFTESEGICCECILEFLTFKKLPYLKLEDFLVYDQDCQITCGEFKQELKHNDNYHFYIQNTWFDGKYLGFKIICQTSPISIDIDATASKPMEDLLTQQDLDELAKIPQSNLNSLEKSIVYWLNLYIKGDYDLGYLVNEYATLIEQNGGAEKFFNQIKPPFQHFVRYLFRTDKVLSKIKEFSKLTANYNVRKFDINF